MFEKMFWTLFTLAIVLSTSMDTRAQARGQGRPAPLNMPGTFTFIVYVIRGSGTALVGGELEHATWDDSNSDAIRQVRGPSVNGTMKNYQTVKWTAGDTIIVPAGVPHAMGQEVTERTDILRVVYDPKKSIQLK